MERFFTTLLIAIWISWLAANPASSSWLAGKAAPELARSLAQEEDSHAESEIELSAQWDGQVRDASLWTQAVSEALTEFGQELLASNPQDAERFCPRFKSLSDEQKLAFWVRLISAMAFEESGFNPNLIFTENFADSKGNPVRSRGLLQISKESALGYDCPINKEIELDNPANNLSCGVRILNRWVPHDNMISGRSPTTGRWRGGARYWAVLRFNRDLRTIRASTQSLPFCKQEPITGNRFQALVIQ